jgi:hypothetical protein
MKTKMNLINNPSLKLLRLWGLLFAATAAFACEKAGYTVWSGSGTFGSSKEELKAMGDTLSVSALTIGDPEAAHCAFVQLGIKVNLKAPHGRKFAF